MAESVLVQLDLNLIPLLNLVAEPVAGDVAPGAGNVGKLYRNTATGRLRYVRDAATVVSLDIQGLIQNSDIAAGAAIALSKLAIDPLARANHTGTQLAATISDLAAVVKAYRLDEFAAPTAPISFNGQKITSLADGSANGDAVNYGQLISLISANVNGQDWKSSVRVAVSTNVNLAAPGASLDGVAMAANDRVLLYGQTDPAQNGLWVWNGAAAALTRATDADTNAEVTSGLSAHVEEGTRGNQIGILTTDGSIVVGTTGLAFTFISSPGAYLAGTGLQLTGQTFSLPTVTVALGGTGATDAPGARANLNVPQRGYSALLGGLSAGVEVDVVHNLGTLAVDIAVYRVSDGADVQIGRRRKNANTVSIIANVDVAASALQVVVVPIV